MARLNSGGFAAGFESGFGLVQKAKKDQRDFELQKDTLKQREVDRKATADYRTASLAQGDARLEQSKQQEAARLEENRRQFDEKALDRESDRLYKDELVKEKQEKTRATDANMLQGVIERAYGNVVPTEDELKALVGTEFDPRKYISPEFQEAVTLVNGQMGKVSNGNLSLSQAFSKTETIEAVNIILGSDIQVNLRDNIGKNLIGMNAVPASLQPKGSQPAVVLDLLITRPDGSVYKDEVTYGRDNNPDADIQPTTVDALLEKLGGSTLAAAAFNNLIETGGAKQMYDMSADITDSANISSIKAKAYKDYMALDSTEKEDLGIDVGSYVAQAVQVQRNSAKDFKHTLGVTKTGLEERLEQGLQDYKDFRSESGRNEREYPELLISGVTEVKPEKMIEYYNAIQKEINNKEANQGQSRDQINERIDEISYNLISKLFGKT